MSVSIESRDLPKIARKLGESGKPAPDWVTADPALDAAYREGAGLPAPEPEPAPTPAATPPAQTSKRGGRPSSARRSPYPSKAQSRTGKGPTLRGRARDLVAHPATLGGDGGGLLLAVFAYPIVVAILQHGPAGAVSWLKAKFLNDETSSATSSSPFGNQEPFKPNGGNPPGLPAPNGNAKPGDPGSNRFPDGRQIPGLPPQPNPGEGPA